MKLKELPFSLFHSIRLQFLSLERLTSKPERELPIVVSLTSIPSRFHILHLTVRSVLNQSSRPEKIVLWLNKKLENSLPHSLLKLQSQWFEIRFSELDCPHLKLAESLVCFPDSIVVTSDDDLLYPGDWLASLYRDHQNYPSSIISHRARVISYDKDGAILPYRKWPFIAQRAESMVNLLPLGFSGVLYPPRVLNNIATDDNLFLKLAPKADDLWWKAMSLSNETESRICSYDCGEIWPILGGQKVSLKSQNVKLDKNRTQWRALVDHFKL
ncbi:MAG: glycosyltransferase family 2 protein [Pseudomonadales bacterium]|nr:glycosyltransferase family 2 protein [Pseudomonadales bacterium]